MHWMSCDWDEKLLRLVSINHTMEAPNKTLCIHFPLVLLRSSALHNEQKETMEEFAVQTKSLLYRKRFLPHEKAFDDNFSLVLRSPLFDSANAFFMSSHISQKLRLGNENCSTQSWSSCSLDVNWCCAQNFIYLRAQLMWSFCVINFHFEHIFDLFIITKSNRLRVYFFHTWSCLCWAINFYQIWGKICS